MKNECSIVRDILPLYLEDMVNDDTADFIKEHLRECSECNKIFETMKVSTNIEQVCNEDMKQTNEAAIALITIKKKIRKKTFIIATITALCLLAVLLLLHFFPVYRIAQVWSPSYYDTGEISMLAYIGDSKDQNTAQVIMRQADEAFSDFTHTKEENNEQYGLLSRYTTASERGATKVEYSLDLWSAHFNTSEGYMWIYYSKESFDEYGNTISGSYGIPSLWVLEKDENDDWFISYIKEHP